MVYASPNRPRVLSCNRAAHAEIRPGKQFAQKLYFSANCMILAGPVPIICPKVLLLMFAVGSEKLARLSTFCASARSSTVCRSLIGNSLDKPALKIRAPGPRTEPGAIFAWVPGAGCANAAGFNQWAFAPDPGRPLP